MYSLYLHWNVETVQEVAAKHQGVHQRQHSVYPARGDHHRLALFKNIFITHVGLIPEKGVTLRRAAHPLLVQLQVRRRRLDEIELFLAAQHVVPDGCAAEVDVKVGETVFDAH